MQLSPEQSPDQRSARVEGHQYLRNSLVTLKKSQEKGEAIAKEYGVTFLEVSAKTDKNVERAFSMLAEAILDNSIDIPDAAGVKLRDKEEKTVPKISNKCCQ